MSADDPGRVQKHSLVIAGHRTSISLEQPFGTPCATCARKGHLHCGAGGGDRRRARRANLSSALRVRLLQDYQEKVSQEKVSQEKATSRS